MADPTTTNPTASAVDSAIVAAWGSIEAIVFSTIIADVPWLGLPIIKDIWEKLFDWISGYFIKAIETGTTVAIIDSQVAVEQSNLSAALQALIAAEKSGDAQAIQSAIQAYANANSALIHSDGSASPQ